MDGSSIFVIKNINSIFLIQEIEQNGQKLALGSILIDKANQMTLKFPSYQN